MASDGDSTEFGPSPLKKPKTDSDRRSDSESDSKSHSTSDSKSEDGSGSKSDSESEFVICGDRRLRLGDLADEEYHRQYEIFYYQKAKSEGFEINWEQFDFMFAILPVVWASTLSRQMSNDELVHMLTLYSIDEHNKGKGTNLVFVEHVKANYMLCQGYMFWITFWARDQSCSNAESKLYQTKVRYFFDEIEVCLFRPRPTDEEIAAVNVPPPLPIFYDPDKPPKVFT